MRFPDSSLWRLAALLLLGTIAAPHPARAFCGFYVSGADVSLYNNATQAVLMREGTSTALSIQNNYKGPVEDFAMVVPVPVILQEENVKTLEEAIFAKVDTLTAPRLVEYWEQDPCFSYGWDDYVAAEAGDDDVASPTSAPPLVNVEAEFTVAEYKVVILSAQDANALDSWLRSNGYNIPANAAPYLEPYVQEGMYFFVAEVDPAKVVYKDGLVVLSPLRFHYESQDFSLPIRLGLINSANQQDLLVYLLARNQRYDVANYPNVTVPTNIVVQSAVREQFGEFYNALFEATLEAHPGAVVTEYAWNASSCDPCPGPVTLDPSDFATLGADVLYPSEESYWDFTITRLHARYTPNNLGEDLIFRAAGPIEGGRGVPDQEGTLSQEVTSSYENNFQGRYVILNPWDGLVMCLNPEYGNWGYPPEGGSSDVNSATSPNTNQTDLDAYTAKEVNLAELIAVPIEALGLNPILSAAAGCGGCSVSDSPSSAPLGAGALFALLGLWWVERKRGR